MPRLIIRDNTGEEIFDMIEDEVIAGRAKDNLLHIDDDGLSRQHCRLFLDEDCYRIEDLGSKNGTLVNATKIKEPFRLSGGDVIGICAVDIEFQWLPGEKEKYEEALEEEEEDVMETGADPAAAEDALEALDSKQEKGQRFRLTIMSESQSFLEHHFDDETITIGRRSDRVITIKDEAASGNHAKLIPDGDGYQLVDEDSRNGTFVKGKKVKEYDLDSGDVIRIGKTELKFVDLNKPASDAYEEKEEEPKKKPKPERNGSSNIDNIPVCNGDTRELPRVDDVEHWRNAKAESAEEEDDDLSNMFGGESTTRTRDRKTGTEVLLATNSGPVTKMLQMGVVEEEEIGEDEVDDTDDSEEQVVQRRKVKPKSHKKHEHPHHHHHHHHHPTTSVMPTIFASLLALAIVGGATYFLFKDKTKKVKPKITKTETKGGGARVIKTVSGDGAPALVSAAQVAMWNAPLPDIPELKTEGTMLAAANQPNPDDSGMGDDEPVIRARPLNSTKRGKNYGGILSDLIKDVAEQNQANALGDEDLGHLARAKELMSDFKLSLARRELQAMTKKEWDYKSALEQLKIINGIISHMDETFASGKKRISLKQIAKSASADGLLVGASDIGVIFRNADGEPEELSWAELKPEERYAIARSCYSKSDAAARAKLGILCLNIGLTSAAKMEFQTAEKLGFKDIERFRALLEREPDSLQ